MSVERAERITFERARRYARRRLRRRVGPAALAAALEVAGVALAVAGVALVSVPVALVVAGVALIVLAQGVGR